MEPGPLSHQVTQPTTLTTTATAYKGFLVGDRFTFYILQKVLKLVHSGSFLIKHFFHFKRQTRIWQKNIFASFENFARNESHFCSFTAFEKCLNNLKLERKFLKLSK